MCNTLRNRYEMQQYFTIQNWALVTHNKRHVLEVGDVVKRYHEIPGHGKVVMEEFKMLTTFYIGNNDGVSAEFYDYEYTDLRGARRGYTSDLFRGEVWVRVS